MLDAKLIRQINRLNASRADDRMRCHVALAIISQFFIGLGVQLGQIWLWAPFCALGGYSVLVFWDYRSRLRGLSALDELDRQDASGDPVDGAQRAASGQQSAAGWPASGGFRPPSRGGVG